MRAMHKHVWRISSLLVLVCAGLLAQGAGNRPLSFQIGGMQFTPGGFMDFTTVYRSSAVGSGIGTNFAAIPYNNTTAGTLSEFRESVQNSRLALEVSGNTAGAGVVGYLEADFLGNAPPNVAVSSNSNTLRMRVYFLDATWGSWEALAGQDWSLLTPNRAGLSPMPSNIFFSDVMDSNYQVGLTWARQPQFRLMYHVSPQFTAGLSIEQGEPYIGGSAGAAPATLPGGASGPYAGQVDNGGSGVSAPGFTPDFIVKAAYDSKPNGAGLHLEAAGLESEFRVLNPATGAVDHAAGGGIEADAALMVAPGLRLIANSFWGDGGGRYLFGMAPDLVIRQNGTVSPVRSSSGIVGFEDQVSRGYLLYGYYGGIYIRPSFDLSGATPVGYGYPGAPASMNRSVQEFTLGLTHTFWTSRNYGTLALITQASYVTRSPFDVATGAPENAHTGMGFADLRYTLP
jgi:hypothetical protein